MAACEKLLSTLKKDMRCGFAPAFAVTQTWTQGGFLPRKDPACFCRGSFPLGEKLFTIVLPADPFLPSLAATSCCVPAQGRGLETQMLK